MWPNNPVNFNDPSGERISVFSRSLDMKVTSGSYVHCVLIVERCDGSKQTWVFNTIVKYIVQQSRQLIPLKTQKRPSYIQSMIKML